ncbi:hypothetical protein CHS0354_007595 [Potamilus streckersoni]|uniref:Uncharacterized protein n=1 Tax=Potamilus streckersoni TaxID=2493646 RepID=A0AAE0T3V1_9BIVA|nr:hypothetical protein CHS0354_007595 [Potamilus streckersoni]
MGEERGIPKLNAAIKSLEADTTGHDLGSSTKSQSAGASVTGISTDSDSTSESAIFEDSQITEIGESDNTFARPAGAVLLQPFDIGELETETLLPTLCQHFVKPGHISSPLELPKDIGNHIFPIRWSQISQRQHRKFCVNDKNLQNMELKIASVLGTITVLLHLTEARLPLNYFPEVDSDQDMIMTTDKRARYMDPVDLLAIKDLILYNMKELDDKDKNKELLVPKATTEDRVKRQRLYKTLCRFRSGTDMSFVSCWKYGR